MLRQWALDADKLASQSRYGALVRRVLKFSAAAPKWTVEQTANAIVRAAVQAQPFSTVLAAGWSVWIAQLLPLWAQDQVFRFKLRFLPTRQSAANDKKGK